MEAHYSNEADLPTDNHHLQGKPVKFFISALAAQNHVIAKHVELNSTFDIKVVRDSRDGGDTGQVGISYYNEEEKRGYAYWVEMNVAGDLGGTTMVDLTDFAKKIDGRE